MTDEEKILKIKRCVSESFFLVMYKMRGDGKSNLQREVRHACVLLMRERGLTGTRIAEEFGMLRCHVYTCAKRAREILDEDPKFREKIERLRTRLDNEGV